MDIVWIGTAFLFGLLARAVGLPPLVGYLTTGFVLFALGDHPELAGLQHLRESEALQEFSELGVTLLLFSIGLKLRLGTLLMPQIWGVAALHMGGTILFLTLGLFGLSLTGLSLFAQLDLPLAFLLAFALSFSSTVFAVKVLEEKGEMSALYGRVSIGILIMQDIAAVAFLAASTGKVPSPWAILLFALIPLRPLLYRILERVGHGELLILLGLTLALGGARLFELVGVKGDLGALILGILLAQHRQASELAKHLLGFKDLFLVGFFLTIGLYGLPSLEGLGVAGLLILIVPLKVALFFWLLTRFNLRSRTAFLTSLSLANYSEFGLIVGAIAAKAGWIGPEWLVMIAVALAISFVVAAPFNSRSHELYVRFRDRLRTWQTRRRIEEEQPIDPGDASVLVFGMGRVGTGAYDSLLEQFGDAVLGLDLDSEQVERHRADGRRVIHASATDPDFWDLFHLDTEQVQLIMLAMPNQQENLFATQQLRERGYRGPLAAIAKYPDEVAALREAGANAAFNLYAQAGIGFADDVCNRLYPNRRAET